MSIICGVGLAVTLAICLAMLIACQTDSSKVKTNEDRIEYLSAYGWQVSEEPIDAQEIFIPEEFDDNFIEYIDLQMEKDLRGIGVRLPTAKSLHDDIGLSVDVIAEVYLCSRNDVLRMYAYQVPYEFYSVPVEKAVQATLERWEKAIDLYETLHSKQRGRSKSIRKKWA